MMGGGGEAYVYKLGAAHFRSYHIGPLVITNQGASFGPRVAAITFRRSVVRGASIIADIDAANFQNESGLRRRGARAAIAWGKEAARRIKRGELTAELDPPEPPAKWPTLSLMGETEVEGWSRRVIYLRDIKPPAPHIPPEFDPEWPAQIAAEFHRLAEDIQATIDDPYFRAIFGAPGSAA